MGTVDRARRHDRRVQLARPDGDRLRGEARPGRAGRRHRIAERSGQPLYAARSPYLLNGTVPTPYLPYLSLSGTSMAAPVVDRHGRADAAGEPVADAERGEGDPAVHRAAVRRLRRADAGRRIPQRERRGRARGVPGGAGRHCAAGLAGVEPAHRRRRTLARRVDVLDLPSIAAVVVALLCTRQLRRRVGTAGRPGHEPRPKATRWCGRTWSGGGTPSSGARGRARGTPWSGAPDDRKATRSCGAPVAAIRVASR